MQLQLSFGALLASTLVALSLSDSVDARPFARNTGTVTLPLKRLHQARNDVHPQILLQQHMNRGHRRVARMTGRAEPATHELRSNLQRRMFLLEHTPGTPVKRFNRNGVKPVVPSSNSLAKAKGAAKTPANAIGSGSLGAEAKKPKGAAGGAGAGATTPAANTTATPANSSSETGAGINAADVAAAASGGLTDADTPTAGDSLGLAIEANDVGYIGSVQMGTPPRNFNILMDSGSADFWVGAENCASSGGGGCGNHTFLGNQSSSTFVDTNQPFQVSYGSGEVSGDIINDNVAIAGLALNNHTFGVATTESVDFSADTVPFDGLMGLAQSTLSQQGVPTPIEALASTGAVKEAITSFKLGRVADADNDGEVTFGGTDPTKFDANAAVTFANVNTQGFWEGPMSVSVGGQDLGLQGRTAILDTGTTLILAPASDAAAVHAAIPGSASDGQGGFTIPCTTTTPVALTFSGQEFAIDSRDLLFAPVDPNNLTGDCVSGISSGQIGGATEWLVGDVFLKNAYFSTDVGQNQITLAKLT